ncbi:hypothetical protein JD969_08700 [Planctomycetota bacterium]|nr:hypothetical protein JD969_08700 [Planctomycetota bacterium]
MHMSNDEAAKALKDIEVTTRQIKERLGMGPVGYIVMLWGAVWMVCFALPYWAPSWNGWGWLIGNSIGFIGTAWLSWKDTRKKDIVSDELKRVGKNIGWMWGLGVLFANGILAVMWPWNGMQFGAAIVVMLMFMYVMMGLWANSRFLIFVGLLVAGLAVAGYFITLVGWLGDSRRFMLWLALMCGGSMLFSGAYIKLRWR